MPVIKRQRVGSAPTTQRMPVGPPGPHARAGTLAGVLDRIRPMEVPEEQGMRMLLYGRSGTGKTTLWSTFPGPILCVLCSGSSEPGELRSVPADRREKINEVVLEHTSEMRQIVDYVRESRQFQTIVLDHASGLQDLTLREILGLEELPAQKSWGLASQQQYGQSSAMCKELFRALLNLRRINVVIIAQERTFGGSDDSGSELIAPTIGAALTPSVTGWLNPACDYVCQTFIRPIMVKAQTKMAGQTVETVRRGKGVEYCLRTEPHDVYMTKFRVPKGQPLPEVIVDPSYDKILAILKGEQAE